MQTITFNNQEFTLIPIIDNDKYFASTNGDIYSLYRNRVMKQSLDKHGYYYVNLHINNKAKTYLVHRLVGMTFILNPENKPQINHLDGIKTNNSLSNLEWVTHSQNIQHAYDNKLHFGSRLGKFGAQNPTSKKVICMETNEIFDSLHCITRKYDYDTSLISKVCRGIYKTAYNLHWKYLFDNRELI